MQKGDIWRSGIMWVTQLFERIIQMSLKDILPGLALF